MGVLIFQSFLIRCRKFFVFKKIWNKWCQCSPSILSGYLDLFKTFISVIRTSCPVCFSFHTKMSIPKLVPFFFFNEIVEMNVKNYLNYKLCQKKEEQRLFFPSFLDEILWCFGWLLALLEETTSQFHLQQPCTMKSTGQ